MNNNQTNMNEMIQSEFSNFYPYDDMSNWDKNLFKSGYLSATKASEIEINSLKELVAELQSHLSSQSIEIAHNDVTLESYAHKVTGLQAHVNRLREAGQAVVERWDSPNWNDGTHTRDFIDALRKAMSSTPENKIE